MYNNTETYFNVPQTILIFFTLL